MSVNTAIVAAMQADAGISAVVSDRVYLLRLPQDSFPGPSITYYTMGDVPKHNTGSVSVLKDVSLTMHLWATSTSDLESLKQAVIAFWNAYEGTLDTEYVIHGMLDIVGTDYEDATGLYRTVVNVDLNMRN